MILLMDNKINLKGVESELITEVYSIGDELCGIMDYYSQLVIHDRTIEEVRTRINDFLQKYDLLAINYSIEYNEETNKIELRPTDRISNYIMLGILSTITPDSYYP